MNRIWERKEYGTIHRFFLETRAAIFTLRVSNSQKEEVFSRRLNLCNVQQVEAVVFILEVP
jgi:hypothetical protein